MLTFDNSSYIGNPNLWGCPLQRNCSCPAARPSPPPAVGVEEKREEDFEFLLYWIVGGSGVCRGADGACVEAELENSMLQGDGQSN